MLSHKGYFTSGFLFPLNHLSWCLARDFPFLEEFSWLFNLMDLGSMFSCKESFRTRLDSFCCAHPESQNMLFYLFYFYDSTLVLWLSCILDIYFYIHCKTVKSGAELCFDRGEPRLPQIYFFWNLFYIYIYIYIQLYLYIFYIKFILWKL